MANAHQNQNQNARQNQNQNQNQNQPTQPSEPTWDPRLWGPGLWFLIHLSALRYPVNPTADDKKRMYAFLTNLQYVLPCPGCRFGMSKILEMTRFGPKDLTSSDALFAWTVTAHSLVNEKTGKPARNDWQKWKKSYMALAN